MEQVNSTNVANSPEFIEQVQLAIDGALRPDEQNDFFQKINNNPRCLEKYYNERKFKQLINQSVNRKSCQKEALIQRIKSNLNGDLRTHR